MDSPRARWALRASRAADFTAQVGRVDQAARVGWATQFGRAHNGPTGGSLTTYIWPVVYVAFVATLIFDHFTRRCPVVL